MVKKYFDVEITDEMVDQMDNLTGNMSATVTANGTASVASATGTAICSVTLEAGTWLIEGNVSFASNATGRRIADLATGSGTVSAGVIAQTGVEVPAVSGGITVHVAGYYLADFNGLHHIGRN